jgi:cell division protein FtsB
MISPEVLAVIGSMIIILLGLNAFFIKELLDSLNQVKLQTAILIEKSTHSDKRMDSNDDRLDALESEVVKLRERHHDLMNTIGSRIQRIEIKLEE